MSNKLAAQVVDYTWAGYDTSAPMLSGIVYALCDCANHDGTRCFPDVAYLIWATEASRATIYRALEELEAKQILTPVGMHGRAVEYHIHLENAALKTPYVPAKLGKARVLKTRGADGKKIKAKSSHHETTSTIKMSHGENLQSHGENLQSHGENLQSHGEIEKRRSESTPDQAQSGAAEASMVGYNVNTELLQGYDTAQNSLSVKEREPEQSRAEHPVRWIDGVPALSWRLQVSQARWREGSADYRRLRVELGKRTHPAYDTWERAIYWGGVSSETQRIAGYRDFTHELNRRWGPQPAPEDEMEGVTP